jgi:putative methionine-R-sulfoxide reductase with GAF domain/GNAT superfamily N-acetyltransferase
MLRQAVSSDVADIQRVRHAVRENRLVSTSISDRQVVEAIEKTGRGWVIERDGEVVAFAVGNVENGNIWALFVHPDHERRGYGRQLHDTMVEWLFSRGLERLWLTTEPGTRAQRFYETAGWQCVGSAAGGELRFERSAIDALQALARTPGNRAAKAQRAVDLIRALGAYRWAGLYDVLATEIAVIAWSGPEAPTHPRFPISKGLNGACVSSGKPVIVQDVARDPRYLTTIAGTRGEMIQPVVDESGAVIGTIDVESDRAGAFGTRDEQLLASCAKSLVGLWRAGS